MFVYPANGPLYVMMTAETLSTNIYEWMGEVRFCYILHSIENNDACKTFGEAEALDFVYASDEEYEGVERTHAVQSKACKGRSIKIENITLFGLFL